MVVTTDLKKHTSRQPSTLTSNKHILEKLKKESFLILIYANTLICNNQINKYNNSNGDEQDDDR